MQPVLFVVGGVPVLSYGVMLILAFNIAALSLWWELRRRQQPTWVVLPSLAVAMVAGLLGARLAAAVEGQDGLNYLGGFLLASPLVVGLVYRARLSPLVVMDSAAPGLCFAYATARLGCHLAGDGDYGVPTTMPWGMAYPHGTVPTLELVHPTPLYELVVSVVLGLLLQRLARRDPAPGRVFAWYLVGSGLARVAIEFLRRNEVVALGLTQAQILSLILVLMGAAWLLQSRSARR